MTGTITPTIPTIPTPTIPTPAVPQQTILQQNAVDPLTGVATPNLFTDSMKSFGNTLSQTFGGGTAGQKAYAHKAPDGSFYTDTTQGAKGILAFDGKGITDAGRQSGLSGEALGKLSGTYGSTPGTGFAGASQALGQLGNAYYGIKDQQIKEKQFNSNEEFRNWLKKKEEERSAGAKNLGRQLAR